MLYSCGGHLSLSDALLHFLPLNSSCFRKNRAARSFPLLLFLARVLEKQFAIADVPHHKSRAALHGLDQNQRLLG